jgi:hypothetical protein
LKNGTQGLRISLLASASQNAEDGRLVLLVNNATGSGTAFIRLMHSVTIKILVGGRLAVPALKGCKGRSLLFSRKSFSGSNHWDFRNPGAHGLGCWKKFGTRGR